jgi:uncharacterized membrane protein YfcA
MAGLLVGLIAGSLGGLVGVGGGVIMVPLMTEWLKFRQQEAHGTSLVAVVFTGIVGTIVYQLHGSVDMATAAVLAGLALLTVRGGARFSCWLPEWKLKRTFGFLLLFVTALLLLKPFLPQGLEGTSPVWIHWAILVFLGAMTGFISGLMGVGGGIFLVPMLVVFAGIPQHAAQGTSLLVMVLSSTLGAWTYWRRGHIRPGRLPGLVAGVVAGVYGGGSVAHLLPARELRLVFALLLVVIALRYLCVKPDPAAECTPQGT